MCTGGDRSVYEYEQVRLISNNAMLSLFNILQALPHMAYMRRCCLLGPVWLTADNGSVNLAMVLIHLRFELLAMAEVIYRGLYRLKRHCFQAI